MCVVLSETRHVIEQTSAQPQGLPLNFNPLNSQLNFNHIKTWFQTWLKMFGMSYYCSKSTDTPGYKAWSDNLTAKFRALFSLPCNSSTAWKLVSYPQYYAF